MLNHRTVAIGGLCAALALAAGVGGAGEAATTSAPGANPGINAPFLDPKMDPAPRAQSFEDEGREVFARRADVVRELDLKPGMAIADIGAGSGFYSELFAKQVGPTGKVYAQEIAPRWIDYLNARVKADGLSQIVVVTGSERSVMLPDNSIDIAFTSDVYHHFEYPPETLASIHRALRPGGRLVVLDYDRIPGVTPPGRMSHLRVGKAEAIAEIMANGFTLEREPALGLKENYFVVFRRK
jgi:predicted methyltransferase